MKIKKRLKDYPPNVPRKLFRLLRECDWNRAKLAEKIGVNGGYISQLLNKGIEPTMTVIGKQVRKKMFLKNHRIVNSSIVRIKVIKPYYQVKWDHLTKEERHKVMKEYIDYKEKNGTNNS